MKTLNTLTLLVFSLLTLRGESSEVLWDVFSAANYDFYQDMKGGSAYYYGNATPEIGFKYNFNNAGTRITSLTPAMEFMNCGCNGLYWVIASYGDELCSSSDFLSKSLLVDFGYSNPSVGNNISVPTYGSTFYAACFGNAIEYDALTGQYHEAPFYAWVEIYASQTDGISVGGSGVSVGDGIVVGQYLTIPQGNPGPIPEPTSGLLLLLGLASLALRRRKLV